MIRYAITDSASLPGPLTQQLAALRALAAQWAALGLDFVQLREKQMGAGPLTELARSLVEILGPRTRLLVNGRADVAIAAGAAGVHLTAHPQELTPAQVRRLFALAAAPPPIISISCHTLGEVERAHTLAADLALFGPVFGKQAPVPAAAAGLHTLREVCLRVAPFPVLALGGVTPETASRCLAAGAAGVAGIRLFQLP